MKMIVGLGNPGAKYKKTRHNIGRDIVERTAEVLRAPAFKKDKKHHALTTELNRSGNKIIFALPETFMNNSGEAVQSLASYYKIEQSDILVVQDEMDFELGSFAFSHGGGAGGHNGVRSIYDRIGDEIPRLRLGIGRPANKNITAEKYVLSNFSTGERLKLTFVKGKMIDAVTDWIDHGTSQSMNAWN